MNTSPSIDDILMGLIYAISEELMPNLANPKAQATAAMMQSLIQELRQMVPVYDSYIVDEHNAMTKVLRDTAGALEGVSGASADAVRERAKTLGTLADVPAPMDREKVLAAHRQLGKALEQTIIDLDVLQRAGDTRGDLALDIVRAHLAPRYARDIATVVAGAGMIGRG